MTARGKLSILALLLAVGAIAVACLPEHIVWHQKLTLELETPSGVVSRSSVVEVSVSYFSRPDPISGNEVSYNVKGEATVVEVLPGRYLFALLDGSEYRFEAAAQERFKGMQRGEWLRAIPRQVEPVSLKGDQIPMLATFVDISDSTSVRQVDPNDLAATFGPGVSLKALTLEITNEPVTRGHLLGWLDRYPETPLLEVISPTDFSFEAQLRQGSFIRR